MYFRIALFMAVAKRSIVDDQFFSFLRAFDESSPLLKNDFRRSGVNSSCTPCPFLLKFTTLFVSIPAKCPKLRCTLNLNVLSSFEIS